MAHEYELNTSWKGYHNCIKILEDAMSIHDLMAHEYELNTSWEGYHNCITILEDAMISLNEVSVGKDIPIV